MKNIFLVVNKKKVVAFLVCLCVIFSHFIFYFQIESYKNVVDSLNKNIFNSFNFNDKDASDSENNIFFVFNLYDFINLGTNKPKLSLPSEEEYILENGVFTFSLKENLVIKCAGNGLVKSVGYLENGLKYVEIHHSGNIITRYENLKIVGVGQNFNVKNIHILGTCDIETPFVFKVLRNDKIIEDFIIENGKIVWQN